MKFPHLEKFANLMKGGGWVDGGGELGCVLVRGGMGLVVGWGEGGGVGGALVKGGVGGGGEGVWCGG